VRVQWNPYQVAQAMQARWEQQGIRSYRMVIDVQEPYFADGLYVLTVEDGVVTDAQAYNSLTYRLDPNAEPYPITSGLVEQYTMERLYEHALRLLEGKWGELFTALLPHTCCMMSRAVKLRNWWTTLVVGYSNKHKPASPAMRC
jgi:hypothetical protein